MLPQGIPLPIVDAPEETVLVSVMPQETRIAFCAAGDLRDFQLERNVSAGMVGNIYLGRVNRVIPGLQSAFIEIGDERAAFLNFVDLVENRLHPDTPCRIESVLHEGQRILVQVTKEPVGSKGARVTTQISLLGRYLVFLPQDHHLGISQKITDEEERSALKERLLELLPESSHHGGYIIRTEAKNAAAEALAHDVARLDALWQKVTEKSAASPPASLIYQDLSLPLRLLREVSLARTKVIWVDDPATFQAMRAFAATYAASLHDKIRHFAGPDLLAEFNVPAHLKKALSPRVDLPGGGYLVIESTESMTTVDVNTGAYLGERDFEETIVETNLEAARAIAGALSLRNIGGIIIIDFIDMATASHREQVLAELAAALGQDKTKVTLHGFTALGLVELTRKRSRKSLKNLLTEPCPECGGLGHVKSRSTVSFEIMQMIYQEAREGGLQEVKVVAAPEIIDALLDETAAPLNKLRDKLNIKITLAVDDCFSRDYFELYPTR